jgi:excisionase family DNA binding protein
MLYEINTRRWEILETKEKLVLNIPEVAKLLGISRTTAYALANSGQLPAIRLGKRIICPKAALEKMLQETGNIHNN